MHHRLRGGIVCLVVSVLAGALTVSSTGQETKSTAPKGKPQLDRDNYRLNEPSNREAKGQKNLDDTNFRLNVEPILEPVGDVAIYRVQIWTKSKRKVYFNHGPNTDAGLMVQEKNDAAWRADFVLMACIERPEAKGEFQFRCMVRGAAGMTSIRDDVAASTQLKKVFAVHSVEKLHEVGCRVPIGELRGKTLSIEVE